MNSLPASRARPAARRRPTMHTGVAHGAGAAYASRAWKVPPRSGVSPQEGQPRKRARRLWPPWLARVALAVTAVGLGLLLQPRHAQSVTVSEYETRYWAWAYGLDGDRLWAMALCESSGDPYSVGPASQEGTPVGLFQIKVPTYYWLRAQLNADPTLAPRLTGFDPEARDMMATDGAAEAHVTAWAIAHGYGYLWACS